MSALKELKVRINSVKSTKKITQVMKMVAASKLRKAQKRAVDATPAAIELKSLINKIISTIPENDLPPLLQGWGNTNVTLVFVIASDKGLCGAYNTNVVKIAKGYLKSVIENGGNPKIVCFGKKATDLLRTNFSKYIIKSVEKMQTDYNFLYTLISNIISENNCDAAKIFYTKFESSISQIPVEEKLLPFEKEDIRAYECKYEPNQIDVLESLLLKNIVVQIHKAIAESQASEYIARMLAMDNATRNADEMVKKLTLTYNRSRQAAITKELIEIISGAEGLK